MDKIELTNSEFAAKLAKAGESLYSNQTQLEFRRNNHATAVISNRFQNIDGHNSVRDAYSRYDYEFFRPNEQIPKKFRDIMLACDGVYHKVAIVRQIIDLMGDFCAGGIELFHPNESIERFYNEWFKYVAGPERSERIANSIYKVGNVVIKRNNAIIDNNMVNEWKRTVADTDIDMKKPITVNPMEIPARYTLLNPISLEVIGEEMAAFTGNVNLALRMPTSVYKNFNFPMSSFDPAILTEGLPRDIQGAMNSNDRFLILDPDKIVKLYYKKDDWQVWAYPLLYSILDDLIFFQKAKLADLTALDGVISHIRLWKLGSLEHKIIPTDAAVNKLASVLLNHMSGGAMDLIWGPDIELVETSTDVYKFLGGEKYESVMSHIHSGLGIPSTLTGDSGGFSKNFLSLRTLIERLEYGRQKLREFWEGEIKLVQKAMGFRYPAQVTFSNLNLHDEVAEKALWVQLADRGLISTKTIQEKFGQIPEIEEIRLNRERKTGLPKIGPYTDGEPDLSKQKIFIQKGSVTPSEVGLELQPKKAGEESAIDMQGKLALEAKKVGGVSGEGRPGGSRDTKPRKQRTEQPRSTSMEEEGKYFMHLVLHANQLQKYIADIVNPYYLQKFNKKNMRQLLEAEEKELESFKFWLLFNCGSEEASEEVVLKQLSQPIRVYDHIGEAYAKLIAEFSKKKGADASYEELKFMRNYLYATFKGEY